MRSLHYSHPKIESTANGLNTIFGILLVIAVVVAIFTKDQPANKPTKLAHTEQLGGISEEDYLIAISSAKTAPKMTLSEQQMQEMDRQASLQTRQEDVAKLKPKAKARYYTSLKSSVWDAVE